MDARQEPEQVVTPQENQQHTLSLQESALTVVVTTERELYISVPDMCEVLGLTKVSQVRRIQRSSNLSPGLRVIPITTRGGRQKMNCLHIRFVEAWLSGIHTSTMPSSAQIAIQHFKQELSQALYDLLQSVSLLPQVESPEHTFAFVQQPQTLEWIEQHFTFPTSEAREDNAMVDEQRQREIISNIPPTLDVDSLTITSYPEDRAIREATLAQEQQWQLAPNAATYSYAASNKLHVYLGDPDNPLELPDAVAKIQQLGESTALTARIVLGLWNLRHVDASLSNNGSAAIRIDEILEWRGVKKHTRLAYRGAQKRSSDGYQPVHRQQVYQDLKLLAQCHLRGSYSMRVGGHIHRIVIEGPYLRVSTVKDQNLWGEEEMIGFFVSPGDWINTYQQREIYFFAEVDRRVFTLKPQVEQHELRLALYLTERWRQQAKQGNYDEPIVMRDLLLASMIPIDRDNLTNRFVPRITAALEKLFEKGILGVRATCLTEIDTTKSHWGQEWLSSKWCLLPPLDLVQQYALTVQKRSLLGKPQREGE